VKERLCLCEGQLGLLVVDGCEFSQDVSGGSFNERLMICDAWEIFDLLILKCFAKCSNSAENPFVIECFNKQSEILSFTLQSKPSHFHVFSPLGT